MKREQKYPDTDTFKFFNANTHNHYGCDCAIRALCTAMNQTWEDTLKGLFEVGVKYGYVPNDVVCIAKYLKQQGWVKLPQPKKMDGTKFTGKEFCSVWQNRDKYYAAMSAAVPANKNIIANIGSGHMVAIIDGKVYDIWDSTRGKIGNIWVQG